MSFFDEKHHDPTALPKDLDPRVKGWHGGQIQTAATPGYEKHAKQAQSGALNMTTKGLTSSKASPATMYGSTSKASAWSKGPPTWSAKDLNNMIPEVQASAANNIPSRHAQKSSSRASERAPTGGQREPAKSIASVNVPPHLRASPKESSPDLSWMTQPPTADKSLTKMKSGKAAKSAKSDSPFPCTYEDCTRGFVKERDMKRHKDEDHDWCRVCNEDCENDEALLFHKIDSTRHICCPICGEDFRSEAGRDRHQRQSHTTQQEVKCVGCGLIFEKGSGLIDHIYHNNCSNKGGSYKGELNELRLRENRATSALYMNQIIQQASTTAREIAAMQPSAQGSIADYESTVGGGINLLDEDNLESDSMQGALAPAGASHVNTTPKPGPNLWPTVSESLAQGFDTFHIGSSKEPIPQARLRGHKSAGWADTPFEVEKPTPVKGEWTTPTMPDYRRNFLPSEIGAEHVLRTDWDFMHFERHPLDNNYHCPFTACRCSFVHEDGLKAHLTSGYHQGTDHRCLKCLKIFKTPVALIAHMESSSARCRMRETQSFGNVLHVVSGGFLGVQGRHVDGTIKIEGIEVENEEDRHIMQVEDDEDGTPKKPVMLLPHQRPVVGDPNHW